MKTRQITKEYNSKDKNNKEAHRTMHRKVRFNITELIKKGPCLVLEKDVMWSWRKALAKNKKNSKRSKEWDKKWAKGW